MAVGSVGAAVARHSPRLQHRRLVMLGDGALAALAVVGGRLRLVLCPAQPLELQPLHRPAMRARHEIPPLIAGLELALDAAQPADRGRRDHEHLAPMREGGGARFGQRDRVAFLVGRGRIGIDLVEKHVARGHGPQAGGRVRPGQHQDAAGELLRQHRVARVPRARGLDALLQRRAVLDQRIDPAARAALGHLHRGQHRQHRPRRVVDHEPDPVVAGLGRADLRGLHERDPLRRMPGRERIHDLAQIRRARGAIPPRLGRGARGQPAMRIRPFRHRQVRIGAHPPAPVAQDVLGPVKPEVEVGGQVAVGQAVVIILIIQARPGGLRGR